MGPYLLTSALATNATFLFALAELAGRLHVRLLCSHELSARKSLHRMGTALQLCHTTSTTGPERYQSHGNPGSVCLSVSAFPWSKWRTNFRTEDEFLQLTKDEQSPVISSLPSQSAKSSLSASFSRTETRYTESPTAPIYAGSGL